MWGEASYLNSVPNRIRAQILWAMLQNRSSLHHRFKVDSSTHSIQMSSYKHLNPSNKCSQACIESTIFKDAGLRRRVIAVKAAGEPAEREGSSKNHKSSCHNVLRKKKDLGPPVGCFSQTGVDVLHSCTKRHPLMLPVAVGQGSAFGRRPSRTRSCWSWQHRLEPL